MEKPLTGRFPHAGGALIGKVHKAFQESWEMRFDRGEPRTRFFGAQATGCNPITDAVKTNKDQHKPVKKPTTICKSLAIGDPAMAFSPASSSREKGGWV